MKPFTLLIKPSGSDCNLDCEYCFYKNRSDEIGFGKQRMNYDVLERVIKDYLQLKFDIAGFAWQGGEPTLMGLDFYKKVVELQKKYAAPNQQINNGLQTNGILIDDDWAKFLSANNFLIGISIDGPKDLHDHYRFDYSHAGTFDKALRAVETCKKHKAQFNILTLLNDKNVTCPDELFDCFIDNGFKFLQFIPCVEFDRTTGRTTGFSVTPQQYGEFLCRIFDRWYEYGPEKLSIRDFDSIIAYCLTGKHTICTYSRLCSEYIVVEHKGDCFCCDFFVDPKWHLGNIFETPIDKIAAGTKKQNFARAKQNLSNKCLICTHLNLCRGGCMKDRNHVEKNANTQSYLCPGYKLFFDHAMPKFMQLAAKFNADQLQNHRTI